MRATYVSFDFQASAKELAEAVDLLLQLQEPADSLFSEFLAHAETRLGEQLTILQELEDQVITTFYN